MTSSNGPVHEIAVADVRTSLECHATVLGLDGDEPAPRTAMLREAAALLARLIRHRDDATGLVRELAGCSERLTGRAAALSLASS